MPLLWTAWNNGKHHATGAGYGLKVPIADRDRYFNREWKSVILEISERGDLIKIEMNVDKPSFWNETCREIINKDFGKWLRKSGLVPWLPGKPPKLIIKVIGERRFRISNVSA